MNTRTVLVAQALAYASTCLLLAANPEAPSVEVTRVRTIITVRQRITAGADAMVVPTCGTAVDQTLTLCTPGVDIEVKSAQTWVRAPFNPAAPLPGGYPIEQQQATTIAPGSSAEFTFTFWKAQYLVKANERLRLRIYTWPTEEAMRARGPKHDIITAPFTVE